MKRKWVIGIDEVGRGPLAGPVYVCAVAIPVDRYKKMGWKGLTDSKIMTAKNREGWYREAKRFQAIGQIRIGVASRSAKLIDTKGIAVCIRECIDSALTTLALDPKDCIVLLDGGLKAPKEYFFQKTIIKGDQKEKVISLASVVAKVTRDAAMRRYHKQYPDYNWYQNKGYGTKEHRKALKNKGISPLHRKTFLTRILESELDLPTSTEGGEA